MKKCFLCSFLAILLTSCMASDFDIEQIQNGRHPVQNVAMIMDGYYNYVISKLCIYLGLALSGMSTLYLLYCNYRLNKSLQNYSGTVKYVGQETMKAKRVGESSDDLAELYYNLAEVTARNAYSSYKVALIEPGIIWILSMLVGNQVIIHFGIPLLIALCIPPIASFILRKHYLSLCVSILLFAILFILLYVLNSATIIS